MLSSACIRTMAVSLVTGLTGGCVGGAEDTGWEGKAQLVQALGVSGGEVPIPWDPVNDQPAYDGTYGELAYTDALAKCSLQHVQIGGWDSLTAVSDVTIAWLLLKMLPAVQACDSANQMYTDLASVSGGGFDGLEAIAMAWSVGRRDPSCNRNLLTGSPDSLELLGGGNLGLADSLVGDQSPYWVPDYQALQAAGMSGSQLAQARDYARDQVEYAYLNSCIAQNLKQHLESSQVAFVSARELTELQRFIMERAGSAAYQFGLLLRSMAELRTGTQVIDNPKKYLPIIRHWADTRTEEQLTVIGQDMAVSIGLLTDAAEQRAELLLRRPESQERFGEYDAEGWLTGGRTEIIESLYGLFADHARRAATVDLSAPEIATLLGFARSADVLVLKGASGQFDITANATELLRGVEEKVRRDACEANGDLTSACWTVAVSEATNQYRIRRDFNIGLDHAEALVKGLLEFGFSGPLSGLDGSVWSYCDDASELHKCGGWGLPSDFGQRVGGQHEYEGDFAATAGGELHLDPKFTVRGLPASAHLSQSWAYLPTYRLDVNGPPDMQGFAFMTEWALHEPGFDNPFDVLYTDWTNQTRPPRRTVGAVPLLAVAREALNRIKSQPLLDVLEPALGVINQAIGADQVVIYPEYGNTLTTDAAKCGAFFNGWAYFDPTIGDIVAPTGSSCRVYERRTTPDDPRYIAYVSSREGYSGLDVAALGTPLEDPDPEFRSARRSSFRSPLLTEREYQYIRVYTTKGDLTDLQLVADDDVRLPMYRGRMEAPDGNIDALTALVDSWPDCTLALIQAQEPCATKAHRAIVEEAAPVSYRGRAPYFAITTPTTRGRVVTYGGRLNEIVERAWAIQAGDWSAPKYDGLGLMREWAPVGDAVMHGGQPGEEAYLFFLRKASEAAREATTAIVDAFDQLESQAKDALALEQAEQKASKLSELEMEAVCGPNVSCSADTTQAALSVLPCRSDLEPHCGPLRTDLRRILGSIADPNKGFPLASAVASDLNTTAPLFERYSGGQLQGLMVQQWSAWKALDGATEAIMQSLFASLMQWNVAKAEVVAAEDEYTATNEEIDAAILELGADKAGIEAARTEYNAQFKLMEDTAEADCSFETLEAAYWSGQQFTERPNCTQTTSDRGGFSCESAETADSWNAAPMYAANAKCHDSLRQAESMAGTRDSRAAAFQAQLDVLGPKREALDARLKAAQSRRDVAYAANRAAGWAVWSEFANQLTTIQATIGTLLAANAAIDMAFQGLERAEARLALDESLSEAAIKQRFGLDRRFRSYDLWRARALSENARRLAIAARRAIEARFVVNLSDMSAPEVFVEAPRVWADDIYDSDLTPPEAVGTTAGPDGDALYANKLTDYLNQLELFVTGYAINRPTATVRSDAEVLQLAGPGQLVSEWFNDSAYATHLAPESLAWSFYCPTANTWVPHPAAGEFGPEVSDLAEACGGRAPTKARLGFWLDPWGRLNSDHISNEPYTARHNTRWRRLAVNLVGTGIRDCSKVADSATCFSEPFLPYDLRHVGPSLVTNYERDWRSLPVPTAFIEGGKALAAEEWLDAVTNGFELPFVSNVARGEYAGRPLGGTYEVVIELTPDVRIERIERVQLLLETEYWVKQFYEGDESDPNASVCGDQVVEGDELCDGNCPTTCVDDGDACTVDEPLGSPLLCNVECNWPVTECVDDDGCCGAGCDVGNDNDCSICGDSVVSGIEVCDTGGATGTCDDDCTLPLCGDGLLNIAAGEECDDGNRVESDPCGNDCQINYF